MNDETLNLPSTVAKESEIELLARETGAPVDTVREIYRVERDKLDRSARIKSFVPVLARRRGALPRGFGSTRQPAFEPLHFASEAIRNQHRLDESVNRSRI